MKRLARAAIALTLVGMATFALWAGIENAPWERSATLSPTTAPASRFASEEVIGRVAQTVANVICVENEAAKWDAVYTGSGVWQVALRCAVPGTSSALHQADLSDPERVVYPIWSFHESSQKTVPLNLAAREFPQR